MPVSLPFSMTKRIGCEVLDDLDLLFFGVLELPRRRLEVLARLAARITFTSVAPSRLAERQQSIAVLPTPMISTRLPTDVDVAEVDRLEPLDADEDLIGVVAAGNVELLALRRAAADEHRVVLLRSSSAFRLSTGVL